MVGSRRSSYVDLEMLHKENEGGAQYRKFQLSFDVDILWDERLIGRRRVGTGGLTGQI